MSTKIADISFLISRDKNFAISMFWLNFYQIAYIVKLIVFLSLYPLLF